MLVRRVARPLLASIFIAGGVNALRDTPSHAKNAAPVVDQTVGKVQGSLPEQLPTDAETLVRVDGAVKIGAGALLALGKFPRLSSAVLSASLVPTTVAGHAFWQIKDPEQRGEQQTQFLKNLGLLGGLLISAVDTGGKPSVGYRARRRARKVAKRTRRTAGSVKRTAGKTAD